LLLVIARPGADCRELICPPPMDPGEILADEGAHARLEAM